MAVLGALPPEGIIELYLTSDVFVLASRFEGYGMALTEAMSSLGLVRVITRRRPENSRVEHGVTCNLSRAGNVWDNAAMENFFSSLKIERVAGKAYRIRDQARADVFGYIERFYNPRRRHSTIMAASKWASSEVKRSVASGRTDLCPLSQKTLVGWN